MYACARSIASSTDLPNIKLYQEYFTDDSARKYVGSGSKILLMCDMRNLAIARVKSDMVGMDNIVMDDMDLQARWSKMINPKKAYLKFRLPYEADFTYLTGTIYLQPYAPLSTEARLLTSDYETMIDYDTKLFDEQLAYHNAMNRCKGFTSKTWAGTMDKYGLLHCWDTIFSLRITYQFLLVKHNIKSKKKTGVLFMDVIQYHIDKYGKKIAPLFADNKVPPDRLVKYNSQLTDQPSMCN